MPHTHASKAKIGRTHVEEKEEEAEEEKEGGEKEMSVLRGRQQDGLLMWSGERHELWSWCAYSSRFIKL